MTQFNPLELPNTVDRTETVDPDFVTILEIRRVVGQDCLAFGN
jgi:hypothetical protein